jgi:hypothetical protein
MSGLPFHQQLSATLSLTPSPHFMKLSHDGHEFPESIPSIAGKLLRNPARDMSIDYDKVGSPAQDQITLSEFLTGLSLHTQFRRR